MSQYSSPTRPCMSVARVMVTILFVILIAVFPFASVSVAADNDAPVKASSADKNTLDTDEDDDTPPGGEVEPPPEEEDEGEEPPPDPSSPQALEFDTFLPNYTVEHTRLPSDDRFSEEHDPFTGDLRLMHTDIVLPGNGGLDLSFTRYFSNSNRTALGRIGFGWDFHYGYMYNTSSGTRDRPPGLTCFVEPTGSEQCFFEIHPSYGMPGVLVSRERWRYYPGTPAVVVSPSGVRFTLGRTNNGRAWSTQISDVHGNRIDVEYSNFSVDAAELFYIERASTPDGRSLDFAYQPVSGSPETGFLQVQLSSVTDHTGRSWAFDTSYLADTADGVHEQVRLETVTLPDGRRWQYTYTTRDVLNPSGLVLNVTYPRGGTIDYGYGFGSATFSQDMVLAVRTERSGAEVASTTYTYEDVASGRITVITYPDRVEHIRHVGYAGPNNAQVNKYAQYGNLIQKSIYSAGGGTLLEDTHFTWDTAYLTDRPFVYDAHSTARWGFLQRLKETRTTRGGATYTTTNHNFDLLGYPRQVVESGPSGTRNQLITYAHNLNLWVLGQEASRELAGVSQQSRSYNSKAMLERVTEDGLSVTFTYHADGTLATLTTPRATTYRYDNYFRGVPRTLQDPNGATVRHTVNSDGTIASVTDARSYTTSYTYDPMGRVTSVTPPPGFVGTTINWAGNQRVIQRGSYRATSTLDGFGREVRSDVNGIVTTTRYDHDDRVIFSTYPGQSNGITTRYDGLGRVEQITHGDGSSRSMSYPAGHIVDTRNERNHTTRVTYQAYGSPAMDAAVRMDLPNSQTVAINRHPHGLIDNVVMGGITRDYSYNAKWQLVGITEPERGQVTLVPDNNGNVLSRTVAGYGTITYDYDAADRLKTRTAASDGDVTTWDYDNNGNVISLSNGIATWTYDYDPHDNPTQDTLNIEGKTFVLKRVYNGLEHLTQLIYPSGRTLALNPDALGRAQSMTDVASRFEWHPDGQLKQTSFINGTTWTAELDNRMRHRRIAGVGGTTFLDRTYTYDGANNLTQMVNAAQPNFSIDSAEYDPIDQLTKVSTPAGWIGYEYDAIGNMMVKQTSQGGIRRQYTYDARNRLANTATTYTTQGQLTGEGESEPGAPQFAGEELNGDFLYDEAGNTIADPRFEFDVDQLSRVRAVKHRGSSEWIHDVHYDGNDRRVAVRQNDRSRYTFYDVGGTLIGDYDDAGAAIREYAYAGGRLLAQFDAGARPGAPGQPAIASLGDGQYRIHWSAASGSVDHYRLEGSLSPDFPQDGVLLLYMAGAAEHIGTPPGAGPYYLRVQACNTSGCGTFSSVGGPFTFDSVPGAPGQPSLETLPDGRYRASWPAATGIVNHYRIETSRETSFSPLALVFTADASTLEFYSPISATLYARVQACNDFGCGAFSPMGGPFTVQMSPPGAPGQPAVDGLGEGRYRITWTPPLGTETSYRLEASTSPSFSPATLLYADAAPEATVTPPASGTYYLRVQACNDGGCGAFSAVAGPFVLDAQSSAPGKPNLQTLPDGRYRVTWAAASGEVIYYRVEFSQRTDFTPLSLLYGTGATTLDFPSPVAATLYVRIQPCRSAGCGEYSPYAGPYTLAISPPNPPGAPTVQDAGNGEYRISWTAPLGLIGNYQLEASTTPTFQQPIAMYGGSAVETLVTPPATGSYYLRVRACNTAGCGQYSGTAGPFSLQSGPPGPTGVPVVSHLGNGLYRAAWAPAAGLVTKYALQGSITADFSGDKFNLYRGENPYFESNTIPPGTYYVRVRACNDLGCSAWTPANGPVVIQPSAQPPSAPGVPVVSNLGNGVYRAAWSTAAGQVTRYELQGSAASNFATPVMLYQDVNPYFQSSTIPPGTYYVRVRACNTHGCSGWTNGSGPVVIQGAVPGTPGYVNVTPLGETGTAYRATWGVASGTVTRYEFGVSTSPNFNPFNLLHNDATRIYNLYNPPSGTYYYRVRACNASGCGPFKAGSSPVVVN